MVLASWRLNKCEIGFSWCWGFQGMVLGLQPWGLFRGAPGWTAVSSVLVESSLLVTPGLMPSESPVPPHAYPWACPGLLWSAGGNSCIRCPLGPSGSESGSVYIPLCSCVLWAAPLCPGIPTLEPMDPAGVRYQARCMNVLLRPWALCAALRNSHITAHHIS